MIQIDSVLIDYLFIFGALSLLGAFAFFIYSILKKERDLQEKEEKTLSQYRNIIKNAHRQARILLEKTSDASANIVHDTKNTNEEVVEELDHVLQTISEKHIQHLKETTELFEKEYREKLENIHKLMDTKGSKMIETTQEDFAKTLQGYTNDLLKQTTSSQEAIDKKIKELFEEAEQEVAEYKKMRLSKIEELVTRLLRNTYKEVLHQSMPESIQKELIVKSLEKAKEEGMFDI